MREDGSPALTCGAFRAMIALQRRALAARVDGPRVIVLDRASRATDEEIA